MSTNKSSGGKRFVGYREPNDPPPKDPFFGGSFDYIEGEETSNHRHRGHRHKEDGGREKDRPPLATIAKECRKHRESHAIPSEAIAENHRERTRRAAPQTPVPLSGDRGAPSGHGRGESDTGSYVRERPAPNEYGRLEKVVSFKEQPAPSRYGRGESDIVFYVRERPAPSEYGRGERVVSYSRERPAPSKHGRGESDIVTYIRERPAAEQPQRPNAHQMAGDQAPSLNLRRDSGLPAWRAPNSERRKPAPPAGNQVVGNPKSSPTPRRNSKPKETPNQDNRGHVQPEQRLYKRVVDPPSLAGFSRFVSPPFSCNKSIDFPPPRGKYEMSGALQSPISVKRRPRSSAKRERLASNDDIVRNKHRGNLHSGNSNGSNGSARRRGHTVQINQNLSVVLEGRRGSRGKGRLNVKE